VQERESLREESAWEHHGPDDSGDVEPGRVGKCSDRELKVRKFVDTLLGKKWPKRSRLQREGMKGKNIRSNIWRGRTEKEKGVDERHPKTALTRNPGDRIGGAGTEV